MEEIIYNVCVIFFDGSQNNFRARDLSVSFVLRSPSAMILAAWMKLICFVFFHKANGGY